MVEPTSPFSLFARGEGIGTLTVSLNFEVRVRLFFFFGLKKQLGNFPKFFPCRREVSDRVLLFKGAPSYVVHRRAHFQPLVIDKCH